MLPELDWEPDLRGPPIEAPAHVLDLITPWFGRRPDAVAVADVAGPMTYGELDRLSAGVATALLDRGRPAVLVHSGLSRWAIVAMLGALRAGVRYVPVDTAFPPQRQAHMYASAGTTTALLAAGVRSPPGEWRSLDLATLARTEPGELPPPGPGPAYTYFTSGSTGPPTSVTISTEALAYSTAARIAYYNDPVDGFLLCSSISFDSSVAGIYWTLATGGRLLLPSDRPANLVAVMRAAGRHSASHLLTVPSLYRLLVRDGVAEELASLRTVIVAGESCPPELVRRHFEALPRARLFNEYGPTECTVWSTVHACVPADARSQIVPIGGPIPGTDLYLRPRGPGEPDELWIGGPGVVAELPMESPPRLAHVRGRRIYRTGDLVGRRADGLLEFRGRSDDQLKVGGVRIELGEIEHALEQCPAVRAAAVGVAHRDQPHAALVAFVMAEATDQRALRSWLLGRLPAVAVPTVLVEVDSLPAQPNGKLDRRALDRLATGYCVSAGSSSFSP